MPGTGTRPSCRLLRRVAYSHFVLNAGLNLAPEEKETMPKKKPYLTVYLSEDERQQIIRLAAKASLPVSRFVKRVCLGQEVRSTVDQEAVLALLHSKADLGRLGGLLKLHLTDVERTEQWHQDLRNTLRRVEAKQAELTAGCDQLVKSLLQRKYG